MVGLICAACDRVENTLGLVLQPMNGSRLGTVPGQVQNTLGFIWQPMNRSRLGTVPDQELVDPAFHSFQARNESRGDEIEFQSGPKSVR